MLLPCDPSSTFLDSTFDRLVSMYPREDQKGSVWARWPISISRKDADVFAKLAPFQEEREREREGEGGWKSAIRGEGRVTSSSAETPRRPEPSIKSLDGRSGDWLDRGGSRKQWQRVPSARGFLRPFPLLFPATRRPRGWGRGIAIVRFLRFYFSSFLSLFLFLSLFFSNPEKISRYTFLDWVGEISNRIVNN